MCNINQKVSVLEMYQLKICSELYKIMLCNCSLPINYSNIIGNKC